MCKKKNQDLLVVKKQRDEKNIMVIVIVKIPSPVSIFIGRNLENLLH